MSPGIGGEIDLFLVILFCEKCAEKCQSVRKRAWAFRNWFAGRIGPDSIEHSWNSLAIVDSHCLELEYSHCILVGHSREPLRQNNRCSLAAGVDSLYSEGPMIPRRIARPRDGAKEER